MSNNQFKRSDRVSHQIKDIISSIFASKTISFQDGLITITKVKTSYNLRFSRIYLSFINNKKNPFEIVDEMNFNIKEYRFHLGKILELQYVPQIKFYYDDSLEQMEHISSLITKANDDRKS